MQILANFPNLIDRWLRYRFQTILVICFLLWTPFLVAETLQVQHSCHPMIHWSGTLPDECQAKVSGTNSNSRPVKKAETQRTQSQEQRQIAQNEHRLSPKPSPPPQEPNQIAQREHRPSSKPSSTPLPQTSNESPPPQQTENPIP